MSSDDKNSERSQNDWKDRFNDLVQSAQSELKKTTKIGMKMISASHSNVQLHEAYEALGKWVLEEIEAKRVLVTKPKIQDLVDKIKTLENELESYEKDVQEIKKENN